MGTWHTDPTELVSIFRRALVALIPVAEAARIPWRDADAYDDWDEIARVLFNQIVLRSLEWAGVGKEDGFTFPEYGMYLEDYSSHHVIGVRTQQTHERLAVVARTTDHDAFDTVACRRHDAQGSLAVGEPLSVALADATFYVERRGKDGLNAVTEALVVEL